MKIKDLPHPKLIELALEALYEEKGLSNENNCISFFNWKKTKQGYDFWLNIHQGKLYEAREIYDWEKETFVTTEKLKQVEEKIDKILKEDFIVKEDMICPVSKKHCDDECFPVGAVCNISSDEITNCLEEGCNEKETNFLIQEEQPVSDFDKVVHETIEDIKHKLVVKGKEYRRNNDVFHNFHEGMKITGQTREDVIWGFALKHFISIQDIKSDLKQGIMPTKEIIDEKYNDLINYLIIEKASILEKIQNNLQ